MDSAGPDPSIERDRAIAQAVVAGDRQAANQVARRLMERVRSLSYYLAAGQPDAEDYSQNAMIQVLRSLGTYRGESPLEGWADRIVIRVVIRQLKDARRRSGTQVPYADVESAPIVRGMSSSWDVRLSRVVVAHLGELKPRFRTALVLKLVAGYSVAEIAEMTDVPLNTVRNRLREGRKKLQAKLRRDPIAADWIRTIEG